VSAAHKLTRTAFVTNRALEFFTEAELRTQIGYDRKLWPIVVAKELLDNALDECENGGIRPKIAVKLEADALTVTDNGRGLPAKVIEKSLDYQIRISDKKYYVSPTRGQLGNALKCIWAVPFVVSESKEAKLEVISCGLRHRIIISLDRIRQEPVIERTSNPFVQNGTSIRIGWPGLASLETSVEIHDLYNIPIAQALETLLLDFAAFNPHADFSLTTPEQKEMRFLATEPGWTHWLGSQPTSAHWYTPERLWDLIAAYLAEEQNGGESRSIREFVSEFDGLRRSQYQSR
jgi:DNA topoisomerase VI subunit B